MIIQPWYNENQIDEILLNVNGILFPGGDRDLDLSSYFEKISAYIIKRVMQMHEQGNSIPIWGTCQGLELIHAILIETTDFEDFDSWDYPSPIKIINPEALILKYFTRQDLVNAEENDNFAEYHRLGIEPSQYTQYPILDELFEIIATAVDRNGKEYIAITQGKNYPIYTVQFHPEMIGINKKREFSVPNNIDAVRISQNLASFYVGEVRKNKNTISEEFVNKYKILDSFVDIPIYDDGFYLYISENK
jgi:glutamine amidotransferase PdxT